MENTISNKAVEWRRVSSRRQKEEGASLEAQRRTISEYCLRNQITIVKDFEVDESAKNDNRKVFLEMVSYLKNNPSIKFLVCEKTDRLLKGNLKDRVIIEELINEYDKEIHCVKEGLVLGKNTKSAQKLHFDIQNALARHFLNNLSDEVKKGYDILVDNGFYPHIPPLGYQSKLENHIAVIDPERAPFIRRAFELCSTGEYSEAQISKILFEEGFRSYKNGNQIGKSSIGKILHTHFYYGDFEWKGEIRKGNHTPIIDKPLFDKVQEVLSPHKRRGYKHDFSFIGIMKCGECGNSITAETQKGHVYYRCTKPYGAKSCSQKYTREEVIEEQLTEVIKSVSLNLKQIKTIKEVMQASLAEETQYIQNSLDSLNKRYRELQEQSSKLLDLFLRAKITEDVYTPKSETINKEMEQLNNEIAKHKDIDRGYHQEIEGLLSFCNEAPALFKSSRPALQRELLRFVVSNLILKDKKVEFSLKTPFDIVAQYSKTQNWQGRSDSN